MVDPVKGTYDPLEIGQDVMDALKLYMKIKTQIKAFPPGPVNGAEIGQVIASVAPDIGALYDQIKAQGQT